MKFPSLFKVLPVLCLFSFQVQAMEYPPTIKEMDINTKNSFGSTLLHHVLFAEGSVHGVRLLVELGAKINVFDCNGFTPLHIAARQGKLEIVKFLVDNNAAINTISGGEWQSTPLDLAQLNGNKEIAEYLKARGAINNCLSPKPRPKF